MKQALRVGRRAVAYVDLAPEEFEKLLGLGRPSRSCRQGRRRAIVAEKLSKSTRFAGVQVAAIQAEGVIEIDLAGGCVRVCGILDAQMLRQMLAA